MDPRSTNQIPGMELPTPETEVQNLSEQSTSPPVTEKGSAQAIEQGVSQAPSAAPPFDMNLGPQPAVSTTAFDPTQLIPSNTAASSTHDLPAIADDNDLIEKEWVEKAKHIVSQTKADPHLQNSEMTKMKIDYLKKRYNKEVKLVEE